MRALRDQKRERSNSFESGEQKLKLRQALMKNPAPEI
jgi:hypothetical protein